MTLANLALARSVNYKDKVYCRLKGAFMNVNYNHKTDIVQATNGRYFQLIYPHFDPQVLEKSEAVLEKPENISVAYGEDAVFTCRLTSYINPQIYIYI